MDWTKYLIASQGYLDLGMGQEAWDELDSMHPHDRARPEVAVMQLVILQSMARWDKAAEIARDAIRAHPDRPELYILGAYAIRRAEDVRAAFLFLHEGRTHLADDPTYWFNRGCYHCQLGEMDDAKRCVQKAAELDGRFHQMALDDEDLKPLWDELGKL